MMSAITLKSELTVRLLAVDAGKAREELVDILGLARQALSEVRSVAGGYRELSLEAECRSAESVLAAADVEVGIDVGHAHLPPQTDSALAVVLREGVTNVLRHSHADHCEIVLRQAADAVRLDIVNDGVNGGGVVPDARRGPGEKSSGIDNLSERVSRLGGELGTRLDADGRFRLWASLPDDMLGD